MWGGPHRLGPLSSLHALTACKLQHCPGIRAPRDLSPLAGLTALSLLDLCGCSNLHGATISSLAPLTSLRCAAIPLPPPPLSLWLCGSQLMSWATRIPMYRHALPVQHGMTCCGPGQQSLAICINTEKLHASWVCGMHAWHIPHTGVHA